MLVSLLDFSTHPVGHLERMNNTSQSTRPTGCVLWEELLILSIFHSQVQADEWNFCPCVNMT